ncbi:hypothetical protein NSQ19_15345 [Weizmannia sp. FSL W8-1119]|uniref:hypothetical protein n=1 Tax=Weizmannia sp. FSL W8-1119 TaxID=2954709 RepID=UPI0030F9D399
MASNSKNTKEDSCPGLRMGMPETPGYWKLPNIIITMLWKKGKPEACNQDSKGGHSAASPALEKPPCVWKRRVRDSVSYPALIPAGFFDFFKRIIKHICDRFGWGAFAQHFLIAICTPSSIPF